MLIYIVSGIDYPNLFIDIDKGNKLALWGQKKAPSNDTQLWMILASADTDVYFIQNPATGLCITTPGGTKISSGSQLVLKAKEPEEQAELSMNQLWRFSKFIETGMWYIASALSGIAGNEILVIDVEERSGKPKEGAMIDIHTQKSGGLEARENQLWSFRDESSRFLETPPLPPTLPFPRQVG